MSIAPDDGTAALVLYLRAEADAAEERAKSLRLRAQTMAAESGMAQADFDETTQHAAAAVSNPTEMAPVDEFGVPKYKGKKRGRKPKKRKRVRKPDTPKRQHTGYTLFMKENYPAVKEANGNLQSKDVISIVAKQWAEVGADAKTAWKERAKAINEAFNEQARAQALALTAVASQEEEDIVDDEVEEDGEDEEEEEEDPPSLDAHHGVPADEVAAAAAAAGAVIHQEVGGGESGEDEGDTPWSGNKKPKKEATSAASTASV